jgi:rhodanese-related sulfurtransferase
MIFHQITHQDLGCASYLIGDAQAGVAAVVNPRYKAIVELNQGPLLTAGVEVLPLTPRQVTQKRDGGALVVDVRTDQQFDDAHIPGAVSITKRNAGFGTRLAWVADRDQEVVLVGRDDEDAREAAKLAVAVGIRKLGGFLAGGMTSWREEKRPVERVERLAAAQLPERRETDSDLQVLDVRERGEWDAGHLPDSLHRPYHDIHDLPEGLDPDRPVAVICASGQRAAVGASLVQRHGARHVIHVVEGGVPALEHMGQHLETGEAAGARS